MASKSIDIKIGSTFNADGVLAANKGLAKLAQDVKAANDEMRKATMRAEMSVNSYAENADKAVRAMGGGYVDLTQQINELASAHKAAEVAQVDALRNTIKEAEAARSAHKNTGETAVEANTAATKSAVGLEMAMGLARGSTEQTAKAVAMLTQKFEILKKIGPSACMAIVAAFTSLISLGKAVKEFFETAFNLKQAPKELREAASALSSLENSAENFKTAMEDAREASQKQLKAFEAEADALNKVTKAQIELNRQRELAGAKTDEERAAINARGESALADANDENEQLKREARRNELLKERSRLEAEIRESNKTIKSAQELFGTGVDAAKMVSSASKDKDKAKSKLAENSEALDLLDKEEEAAEILIEARKQKEENAAAAVAQKKADEEAKAAKKLADEKAKADAEAAKKAEADRLAAVEAERKAREKMEADLHAQRVANAKDELAASTSSANKSQDTISRAQTEFDRAFGMYRSADHGAAQIAEERDYAADYKQLQKDAARYGGKWRIDELASLMEAGDTKGQAAKLEEWRKSSSFTPEVESMVRAAAADQTKTTAEDELRKISKNTEDLGKKLEELLAMK